MRHPAAIAVLSAAIAFLLPSAARADWDMDPNHTGIHFKVRHLMVSTVRGDFEKFSGKVRFDERDVTKSTATVTIDAASINTRIAKRDADLRSPNFLDTAKFPTIVFVSKKVEAAGPGMLRMTGDLTIHGITKEVVLAIEGPATPAKDPWGNLRVGGAAVAKINRKDFGLTYNMALETGGVLVGDEVEITIDVELVKSGG